MNYIGTFLALSYNLTKKIKMEIESSSHFVNEPNTGSEAAAPTVPY
jgi:hypothetical protein